MKKIISIVCLALFVTSMAMNLQYAIDGYGIIKNAINMMILADETGTTSTGTGTAAAPKPTKCHLLLETQENKVRSETKYNCYRDAGNGPDVNEGKIIDCLAPGNNETGSECNPTNCTVEKNGCYKVKNTK